MSKLHEALDQLRLVIATLPQRHVLPPEAQRATHKAMLKISNGHDAPPAMPQPDRLNEVWRDLCMASAAGQDLAALPPRTLRDAIWLLWDRERGLADLPGLLPLLLARAEANPGMLRRLIEAWLRDFDPALPDIPMVGSRIAELLEAHDAGPLVRWRAAHASHGIFDASTGPAGLAGALLNGLSLAPLAEARLDTPMRANGGFMRAVTVAFGEALPARLRRGSAAAVFAAASAFFAPGGTLRFDEPTARGAMADALVGAWVNGAGPEAARADALGFLRHHLGDPRINPSHWAQAKEATMLVVRGWLAQLTLDAFFNVIGQFAAKAGFDSTWQQRKKFWSACLRQGWISDSWLALGPNVSASVAVSKELHGSFGSLDGASDKNHSVLLMQIGGLVFAEWSHNGKVRAWTSGSTHAPKLSPTRRYKKDALQAPGLKFPRHFNSNEPSGPQNIGLSHMSLWQVRVAKLLRENGFHLDPKEWA